MKIRDVVFTGSFGYPHRLPREQRPEVALFGRSNVGKSSLINTILMRHNMARISKTPGKTRSANYFLINDRFHLVDMPGYGYAKVSRAEAARWVKIYEQYLEDDTRTNALVQMIDSRHDPTPSDIVSVRRMSASGRPLCIVFSKVDKAKKSQMQKIIRDGLAILRPGPDTAVVPFSSVTGVGRDELWAWIEDKLSL